MFDVKIFWSDHVNRGANVFMNTLMIRHQVIVYTIQIYLHCSLFLFMAGCQNTPAKGCRYCEIHKEVANEYVNDEIRLELATLV